MSNLLEYALENSEEFPFNEYQDTYPPPEDFWLEDSGFNSHRLHNSASKSSDTFPSHPCKEGGSRSHPLKADIFMCSKPPTIGIRAYISRLYDHCECSDACFIAALMLIDRINPVQNFRITNTTSTSKFLTQATKFNSTLLVII